MISTFLVEHSWAVPLTFGTLVVGCVLVGTLLLRTGDGGRRVTRVLAVLAALAVIPMTLFPEDGASQVFCAVRFAWPSLRGVETLANIALLLPAAFFFTLLWRRPMIVVLSASACSALIELTQALLPAIGRACDTTDWEMNTIGGVIGALLVRLTYLLNQAEPSVPSDRE